jgi:hypothetical protein
MIVRLAGERTPVRRFESTSGSLQSLDRRLLPAASTIAFSGKYHIPGHIKTGDPGRFGPKPGLLLPHRDLRPERLIFRARGTYSTTSGNITYDVFLQYLQEHDPTASAGRYSVYCESKSSAGKREKFIWITLCMLLSIAFTWAPFTGASCRAPR